MAKENLEKLLNELADTTEEPVPSDLKGDIKQQKATQEHYKRYVPEYLKRHMHAHTVQYTEYKRHNEYIE